jgi:hypothetical protein
MFNFQRNYENTFRSLSDISDKLDELELQGNGHDNANGGHGNDNPNDIKSP